MNNNGVRPGSMSDLDAVMVVMEAAFDSQFGEAWTKAQLTSMMIMPGILLLVHENNEQMVDGFALFSRVVDESELLLVAVDPVHRREGIADNILDQGYIILAEHGVKSLFLEVRDGNPAMHLYRAHGFEVIGRRPNYYHGSGVETFDALTLRKWIA